MNFLLVGLLTVVFLSHLFYSDCSGQQQPEVAGGVGRRQTVIAPEAGATPRKPAADFRAETPSSRPQTKPSGETDERIDISKESGKTISPTDRGALDSDLRLKSTAPNNRVSEHDDSDNRLGEGYRWRQATRQSLMFLTIQHAYAFTQPKTRSAIKGKFWNDYVTSVKSLRGWADGGRFFTNYVAHPMQGAFLGYIQIQNDPKGMKQQFGASGKYWRSRMKAMAWSAAWSTQFEIGPVSQASIGNVGVKGKQTYIDIVITPTVGTGWLIAEDAMDRYLIKRIERRTNNLFVTIFSRMLLNPTRTVANIFRQKKPWHRDRLRTD